MIPGFFCLFRQDASEGKPGAPQTSKMESFATIVNSFKISINFAIAKVEKGAKTDHE